ncbi:hypothetical protein GCM10011583_61440 [Streptomyces camponoticapitis]|uniref:Regulatory protein n=1 Tax=Streptomyces camponoticapitis TaxID=1616125 RepID=A0ABQ2EQN5_9ACTN|nr:hypothetical protein [Streptomyces camponoticapitis]GGK21216.1 hypothetical protein GCM10011583_61440 [Streptomyces camponoticapitis]
MRTTENNTIKTQYAEQVAADLERNTVEQERIRAEVAALQAQLSGLEQDHELLEGVRAALGDTGAVQAPTRRSSKKAPTPSKSSSAKKTAGKETAGKKTAPLTELIHAYLREQSEPRTAGEIAKALTAGRPTRNINDNLVRTTTERLVARSRVERSKQGATVHYTASPQDGSASTPAPADKEPASTEA